MPSYPGVTERAPTGDLTRRQFLQLLTVSTVGAVGFTGCLPGERAFQAQSRVRLPEDLTAAYENWYATACRQCPAGCGVIARVIEGRAKKLEGNPSHPLNVGKLCARGQAGVQAQYHPDRLQGPLLRTGERGSGSFLPITWSEALDRLVGRLRDLQGAGQTGQVALLTGSLTGHRALVVDRFATAYGAQRLTFEPLPESPLREAVRRVFGRDTLPVFDIQNATQVLSFGADFLGGWLSPVYYGRQYGIFRQGSYRADGFEPRQDRPRGHLIQVEPRLSVTAASADEWVPVRPGREGLLALSLAQVIVAEGLADPAGAAAFDADGALEAYRPDRVAEETGVAAERIRRIAHEFATRQPSVALAGGAAAAHTNGTDNLTAALALNLLVGGAGRTGGVLFSPPPIAGLPGPTPASSLGEWQGLADRLRAGQVQAVLVHDANPAYGLPPALGFREALQQAPFIASFASFLDETTALADLILPSHLPLEEWSDAVPVAGPGAPALTIGQPVVRPLYDTRSFWDVLLLIGEELGGGVAQALPWPTFRDVLRDGVRRLPPGPGSPPEVEFERFWVQVLQQGGWWSDAETVVGEAAASPGTGLPQLAATHRAPEFAGGEADFPYHLIPFAHNTLGAGETAHLPWLQAAPDPITTVTWQTWVEVNPRLATELGLREGDIVAVESPQGRLEVPVYVNPAAPPTVLAMPLGQGHTVYGRWAEHRGVNPLALLTPLVDEATGTPAYAATRARLVKTGRRRAVPKFEGTVPAYQLPGQEVLQVTGDV